MSVKIMSKVWDAAPCRENALITLLALADWANDEGVCWPSIQTLADKARVDRRSAQRIVRKLAHDGLITIEEGGGRAKQHRYKIETAALCRPLENSDFQNSDLASTQRATLGAERATFPTETATRVSPDPLEEPLEEPSVEPPTPLEVVFAFYKTHLDHERTILTDERRKLINRRLREGYSADDLSAAIRGCKLSAFHQGENDRGTIYDSIELIFKDAQHVETFIARAEGRSGHNGNGHKPTASEQRVDQLRSNLEFIRSGGRSVNS